MQGSRLKSGKDNEEEGVQITAEAPRGTTDETSFNPDIPIIQNIPKAIEFGNVIFPGTTISDDQVDFHKNYSQINQTSAAQQHNFCTENYFLQKIENQRQESSIQSSNHFEYNPTYGHYPYPSNPSASSSSYPTHYDGLGNNLHSGYNF